jgi:hypothetical protein
MSALRLLVCCFATASSLNIIAFGGSTPKAKSKVSLPAPTVVSVPKVEPSAVAGVFAHDNGRDIDVVDESPYQQAKLIQYRVMQMMDLQVL